MIYGMSYDALTDVLTGAASLRSTPRADESALRIDHHGPYGARLVTLRPLDAGQTITLLSEGGGFVEVPNATRCSIQIDERRHIEHHGAVAFLNHSCVPNCSIDTGGLALVARRRIAAGDELTLYYPATEWEMAEPFACQCGAPECLGTIAGARYVHHDCLQHYAVSQHIRSLIAAASGAAEAAGAGVETPGCPRAFDAPDALAT